MNALAALLLLVGQQLSPTFGSGMDCTVVGLVAFISVPVPILFVMHRKESSEGQIVVIIVKLVQRWYIRSGIQYRYVL